MPTEVVQAVVLAGAAGFALLAVGVIYVGYRILRADPESYRENQRLFGNKGFWYALKCSFQGKASVCDGNADYYRVYAGLAFNLKTKELEPQGQLSNEAARSVHEAIR